MRIKFSGLVASTAVVVGLLAQAGAVPAQASTASNLTTINMGYNDSFWNYDFNSTAGGNTNVDWAMSLLFYSNAEINKVKNILYDYGFQNSGSAKYARLSDGAGGVWDVDGGVKTNLCYGSHIRLYADSDDRMNNPTFGYYIIGTTHEDENECTGGSYAGNSEAVENDIISNLRFNGYNAIDDRYGWANYEPPRWEGNHHWDNNGLASTVIIP